MLEFAKRTKLLPEVDRTLVCFWVWKAERLASFNVNIVSEQHKWAPIDNGAF